MQETLAEKIKRQEAEAKAQGYASQSGNDWFKVKEGDNVVRVLTEPEMIFEKYKVGICYTDCGYEGTPKFLAYVAVTELNVDGQYSEVIKLAKFPYKVGTAIAEFQVDEDYAFENWPMPYNVKIKAKNANTKEVEYNVVASPKLTPVSSEVLEALAKKMPIPEVVQRMKEKKKAEHMADGSFQANQKRREDLQAEIQSRRGVAPEPEATIQIAEDTAEPPEEDAEYPTKGSNPDLDPADIPF